VSVLSVRVGAIMLGRNPESCLSSTIARKPLECPDMVRTAKNGARTARTARTLTSDRGGVSAGVITRGLVDGPWNTLTNTSVLTTQIFTVTDSPANIATFYRIRTPQVP